MKGRLLTCYSPVRHSCTPEGALPFDLHVLSTPPAFVLSQDQTLHRKPDPNRTKTDKIVRIIVSPKKSVADRPKALDDRALQTNSSTMTHC